MNLPYPNVILMAELPRPLYNATCCLQIEQEEEESAIDAKRRKRLGTPDHFMQLSCLSCIHHVPLS